MYYLLIGIFTFSIQPFNARFSAATGALLNLCVSLGAVLSWLDKKVLHLVDNVLFD
jgi:hypothetical protein